VSDVKKARQILSLFLQLVYRVHCKGNKVPIELYAGEKKDIIILDHKRNEMLTHAADMYILYEVV
jgi:hypothetical protein